jgi:hypothetical protein
VASPAQAWDALVAEQRFVNIHFKVEPSRFERLFQFALDRDRPELVAACARRTAQTARSTAGATV